MKRYLFILAAVFGFAAGAKAMDYETARNQAYYLTDKMAYELNLSDAQYNDAYEINLDYLLALNSPSDIELAYLRHRNEDLRYILMDWQWRAFMAEEYLFNPVRWVSGAWYFPIYRHYARTHFFYSHPRIYWDYRGAHARRHYAHSYYANRRPHWNGGLRGHSHTMIGRPNHRPNRPSGNVMNRPNHRPDRFDRPANRPNRPNGNIINRPNERPNRPNGNVNNRPNERPNRPNTNVTNRPSRNDRPSGNVTNRPSRMERPTMRSSSRTTVNTMRSNGSRNDRATRGNGHSTSRGGGHDRSSGRR